MDYKNKYLKYKQKYIYLQQLGGGDCNILFIHPNMSANIDGNIRTMCNTNYNNKVTKSNLSKIYGGMESIPLYDIIVLSGYQTPFATEDFPSLISNLKYIATNIKQDGIFYILNCNLEVMSIAAEIFNSHTSFTKLGLNSASLGYKADQDVSFASLGYRVSQDVVREQFQSYFSGVLKPDWFYKDPQIKYIPKSNDLILENTFLKSILTNVSSHNTSLTALQNNNAIVVVKIGLRNYNIVFNDYITNMTSNSHPLYRYGYYVKLQSYERTLSDKENHKNYNSKLYNVQIVLINEAFFSLVPQFSNTNLTTLAMQNFNLIKRSLPTTSNRYNGNKIEVVELDWSIATIEATKQYRQIFAVLNMANENTFGGGYKKGSRAQEEDMFRKTNCMLFSYGVDQKTGKYFQEMTNLINGSKGFVFLDTIDPRVIIRDTSENGYKLLKDNEYIPFWELRAAAVNLGNGAAFEEYECNKRIRAQFETLIHQNVKHVILSAFGCGAFRNPPDRVAQIYNALIQEYKEHFEKIIFAIIYSDENLSTFRKRIVPN